MAYSHITDFSQIQPVPPPREPPQRYRILDMHAIDKNLLAAAGPGYTQDAIAHFGAENNMHTPEPILDAAFHAAATHQFLQGMPDPGKAHAFLPDMAAFADPSSLLDMLETIVAGQPASAKPLPRVSLAVLSMATCTAFRAGEHARGIRWLHVISRCITCYTDVPGTVPTRLFPTGWAIPGSYNLPAAIQAFLALVLQGLWGGQPGGHTPVWAPAIPDTWHAASLCLPHLQCLVCGTPSHRLYRRTTPRAQPLLLQLPLHDRTVSSITPTAGTLRATRERNTPTGAWLDIHVSPEKTHELHLQWKPRQRAHSPSDEDEYAGQAP